MYDLLLENSTPPRPTQGGHEGRPDDGRGLGDEAYFLAKDAQWENGREAGREAPLYMHDAQWVNMAKTKARLYMYDAQRVNMGEDGREARLYMQISHQYTFPECRAGPAASGR